MRKGVLIMRASLAVLFFMLVSLPAFAFDAVPPTSAYQQVQSGAMILVDIRRPDEWALTGSAKGALRINMLDGDFKSRIEALRRANPGKKIGLICQAGVRSARMSQRLEDAGLTGLADITGGTQEWIEKGLPLTR
jgi:rhodanese-related sulfurtransferase